MKKSVQVVRITSEEDSKGRSLSIETNTRSLFESIALVEYALRDLIAKETSQKEIVLSQNNGKREVSIQGENITDEDRKKALEIMHPKTGDYDA